MYLGHRFHAIVSVLKTETRVLVSVLKTETHVQCVEAGVVIGLCVEIEGGGAYAKRLNRILIYFCVAISCRL